MEGNADLFDPLQQLSNALCEAIFVGSNDNSTDVQLLVDQIPEETAI